jgi:hypothetical protein
MTWLSLSEAGRQGIDVELFGSPRVDPPRLEPPIKKPESAISAPTAPKTPTISMDKTAIQRECSDQATARGLHGDERQVFRRACKKALGMQ